MIFASLHISTTFIANVEISLEVQHIWEFFFPDIFREKISTPHRRPFRIGSARSRSRSDAYSVPPFALGMPQQDGLMRTGTSRTIRIRSLLSFKRFHVSSGGFKIHVSSGGFKIHVSSGGFNIHVSSGGSKKAGSSMFSNPPDCLLLGADHLRTVP